MTSSLSMFFPPGATSSEEYERIKTQQGVVGSIRDYVSYEQAKGMLSALQAQMDPSSLQDQALRAVETKYGGREGVQKIGKDNFVREVAGQMNQLLQDYTTRASGLKTGIEEFERIAGTAAPGQPLAGEPREMEGVTGATMKVLGGPSRSVSAGLGGVLEALQKGTADVPVSPEGVETRPQPRSKVSGWSPGLRPEKVAEETRWGGVPVGVALERLLTGKIKLGEVVKEAGEHAAEGLTTMKYSTPEDLSSVLQRAQEMYRERALDAAMQRVQRGELQDKEEFAGAVEQGFQDLVQSDPLAKNPETTQLLTELILDPYNAVTPLKLIKLLKKVPGTVKLMKGAKGVALKATRAMRHLPEYDALRLLDSPESVRLLDLLSQSEARADLVARVGRRMANNIDTVAKVKDPKKIKYLHNWATTPKASRPPVSSLPADLRPAAEAAEKLEVEHRVLGRITGVERRWEGGVLKEAGVVGGYVPRRVKDASTEAAEGLKAAAPSQTTLQPASALRRTGEGEGFVKDVAQQWAAEYKDFVHRAQAAYEVKQVEKALKGTGYFIELDNPAAKLRGLGAESLAPGQAIKEASRTVTQTRGGAATAAKFVPSKAAIAGAMQTAEAGEKLSAQQARALRAKMVAEMGEETLQEAKTATEAIAPQLKKMADETGVEWGLLEGDKKMHELWGQITGTPLVTELGEKLHLMPKPVIDRIATLVPVLAKHPNQMSNTLKMLSEVDNKVIAPLNSVFRTGVTQMFPPYHFRNMTSAVGMAAVANGFRMFNPRLQFTTAKAVLAAAGFGSSKAYKIKMKLPSGEVLNAGELVNMARQHGLLNQFDELLQQGKRLTQPGPLGGLHTAMQKMTGFGDRLSARAVGNATENWQKMVIFAGALEGKSKAAQAKAMRVANDFAASYRNLGHFDKVVMSEAIPFWAWSRAIVPWTVKRTLDSPAQMAAFEKLYRWNESEWERNFKVSKSGLTQREGTGAWMARRSLQPKWLREYVDTGKAPELGSEQFVKMFYETPITFGLSPLEDLWSAVGEERGTRESRERLMMHLGPLVKSFFDLVTGEDIVTGQPITKLIGMSPKKTANENLQGFLSSAGGRLAQNYAQRPLTAWNSMARLLQESNQPEALVDLRIKAAARNAWGMLDYAAMAMLGREEKAFPLTLPGASIRVISPTRQQTRAFREGRKFLDDAIFDAIHNERFKLVIPQLIREVE